MIDLIFASSEYMSNNVVRKTDESESESGPLAVVSGDGQTDLFSGQKKPAPYLHDPKVIHDASPAYYLKNEGLTALMRHLQDAVSDCGPMQVIIAEHGRGKSALIQQLVTEAGEQWLLCHIHADYHLGVDHIINGLGQTFMPDEPVDFESLVSGLVSSVEQSPSPVVIVDDAQNISSYALETLANIKRAVVERGGEIAIILCASPELRRNLISHGMAQFKDKWFEVHALPRFNEEDTTAYLNSRFESNGTTQFTPAQLQAIHRRSCGIPACINYHAELALGRMVSDERLRLEHQQMLGRQKKMPYFIGGAVAAMLVGVVTILPMINSEPDELIDEARIAEVVAPASTPVVAAPPAIPAQVQPIVEKKAVEVKQPVAVQAKPVAKAVSDVPSKSLPIKVEPKLVSQEKLVTVDAETKPVVAKPTPAPEVKTVSAQQDVVKKTVAPMAASSDETIPGAKWLKAQPADYFTIQLAGSPDEKSIIRYITRSSLDGELAYVLLERKNRSSWYVVLHGSFESRAEANRVVEFFPPELKKNKPWIRQFSKLRNALDEN
jgi:septal ring-binding cell division protein DamX/type II secretory pathway predicted ATPase ExeA